MNRHWSFASAGEAGIDPGAAFATKATAEKTLRALAADFSIELLPGVVKKAGPLSRHLPEGTRVYIPWLPGAELKDAIVFAHDLSAAGFVPVPHIAARRLGSRSELDEALAALCEDAGVRELLVIAGEADRQAGPFSSSLEVLESGLPVRHGITRIGIAGHPEGAPDIDPDAIWQVLRDKQAWFAAHPQVKGHIVTQFSFSATAIHGWLKQLGEEGMALPVRIGLAGPAKLSTHLRYARICGVSSLPGMVAKHAGKLMQLAATRTPEPLLRSLAALLAEDAPAARVEGLHYFTFGGLEKTAQFARALAT